MIQVLSVTKLLFDTTLYPRQDVSSVNINSLCSAIRVGAHLPAVIVDAKSLRIVDGVHRWKAYQKVYGDNHEIECDLREYESEAELFKAAVELNAVHGHQLTPFERAKCLIRLEEFGYTRENAALALRTTLPDAERMLERREAVRDDGTRMVLKGSLADDLRGRKLTRYQSDINERAGGLKITWYINQVIDFLDAGVCSDEKYRERLETLQQKLELVLTRRKKAKAS